MLLLYAILLSTCNNTTEKRITFGDNSDVDLNKMKMPDVGIRASSSKSPVGIVCMISIAVIFVLLCKTCLYL